MFCAAQNVTSATVVKGNNEMKGTDRKKSSVDAVTAAATKKSASTNKSRAKAMLHATLYIARLSILVHLHYIGASLSALIGSKHGGLAPAKNRARCSCHKHEHRKLFCFEIIKTIFTALRTEWRKSCLVFDLNIEGGARVRAVWLTLDVTSSIPVCSRDQRMRKRVCKWRMRMKK